MNILIEISGWLKIEWNSEVREKLVDGRFSNHPLSVELAQSKGRRWVKLWLE